MQKIRNRSNFFQKIFHIRYISRIFEIVHAFQNFFQKIFLWHPPADRTSAFQQYSMRQFAKFAKTTLYRGYIQNDTPLCCCFRKKFRKTSSPHHWLSVFYPRNVTLFSKKIEKFLFPYLPYHRLGVVFVPFSPQKQAAKKRVALPLYQSYFQNLPQLRCCFPKKSEKNITSTPLTIKIPPCFVTPFFNFFSKIFVSPLLTITFLPRKGHTCSKNFSKKTPHCWLSHFFCVLFLHSWKKLKIFPSGNKKLMAGYNQQQSSRTGILTPAALREICIYYCYWTGYIRILRLIMYSAKQSLNLQGDT